MGRREEGGGKEEEWFSGPSRFYLGVWARPLQAPYSPPGLCARLTRTTPSSLPVRCGTHIDAQSPW